MSNPDFEPRGAASHPDDPSAPLADRLMLALGMWPNYVDELGVDAVLDGAADIRMDAHRFGMCSEDYGALSQRYEDLKSGIERLIELDQFSWTQFTALVDRIEQ